jgi:hypothetical protein
LKPSCYNFPFLLLLFLFFLYFVLYQHLRLPSLLLNSLQFPIYHFNTSHGSSE